MQRIWSLIDAISGWYRRTGLTVRGLLALATAVCTLIASLLVLGVTSEDVLGRNGM